MENKIYTKTGDKGETSLLGGKRVPKYHPRVEAYGNVDELNSNIGFLRSQVNDKEVDIELDAIQHRLYFIGSLVACDSCKEQERLTKIDEEDINILEKLIDTYTSSLPELNSFIMPSGTAAIAVSHICRTVCRRAERSVILLAEKTYIDNLIIKYLNRLSDFLFVLSRKITSDSGLEEVKYK